MDGDVRVQAFNSFFGALFERPEEDVLRRRCGNTIGCGYAVDENVECGSTTYCSQCELRAGLVTALSQGRPTLRRLMTRKIYIGGQPTTKHLFFTIRPLSFGDEKMALIVLDDVTQIEEQRARLAELNDLKNRFLGMAAHDLRNPIGAIVSYVQLFRDGLVGDVTAQQSRMLENMGRAGHGMLELIDDLLDLSAIESGRLDLAPTEVVLEPYLREIADMQAMLASAKSIRIALDLAEAPVQWRFDGKRVAQVLGNLLSNAVKFSHPGTQVIVRVAREGGNAAALLVEVSDQGQGIPEEEISKLFSEFSRASTRPTSGEHSTGLGLAIARRIVEAHGGRIWVTSQVGRGSTFRFTLGQ